MECKLKLDPKFIAEIRLTLIKTIKKDKEYVDIFKALKKLYNQRTNRLCKTSR